MKLILKAIEILKQIEIHATEFPSTMHTRILGFNRELKQGRTLKKYRKITKKLR